jgi:hypothetical protein
MKTGTVESILVGAFICALIFGFIIRPLYFAPLSHVPGPIWCKLSWYHLAYFDAQLRRNDKIVEWHQKHGPIICIRPDSVSVADPILMREIYGTSGKCAKSAFFDNFITYGARALYTTLPYWEHRQKRSLITSFYHKTKMYQPAIEQPMRQRMFRSFDQIKKRLPADVSHATLDIYPILNCFAFDNVTSLLYGPRHCSHTIETDCDERPMLLGLKQFQVWGPLKFNFPLVARLPLLTKHVLPREFHDSLTADGKLATWNWNKFIEASQDEQGVDDHTLLRRLLMIKDKEGKSLETNYIAVELYDNLIAGQETTAVALTYVGYHLAKQPFWQEKIREELKALPVQEDGSPSLADIDAAPLFDAFIHEVYRVNPGSSGRQERYIPDSGKEYNGVYLPQGVRCTLSRDAEPPAFSAVDCALLICHSKPGHSFGVGAFIAHRSIRLP